MVISSEKLSLETPPKNQGRKATKPYFFSTNIFISFFFFSPEKQGDLFGALCVQLWWNSLTHFELLLRVLQLKPKKQEKNLSKALVWLKAGKKGVCFYPSAFNHKLGASYQQSNNICSGLCHLHCTTAAACYYNLLLLLQLEISQISWLVWLLTCRFFPAIWAWAPFSKLNFFRGYCQKIWKKCHQRLPPQSPAHPPAKTSHPWQKPLKHTSSPSSLHEAPKKGDPKHPRAFVVRAKMQSFHF